MKVQKGEEDQFVSVIDHDRKKINYSNNNIMLPGCCFLFLKYLEVSLRRRNYALLCSSKSFLRVLDQPKCYFNNKMIHIVCKKLCNKY